MEERVNFVSQFQRNIIYNGEEDLTAKAIIIIMSAQIMQIPRKQSLRTGSGVHSQSPTASSDILPLSKLLLLKVLEPPQTEPPAEDLVMKHLSLWGTFLFQTATSK